MQYIRLFMVMFANILLLTILLLIFIGRFYSANLSLCACSAIVNLYHI